MSRIRSRTFVSTVLVCALLALAGCSAISGDSSDSVTTIDQEFAGAPEEMPMTSDGVMSKNSEDEMLATDTAERSGDVAVDATDRLIIRNKTMRIEVEEVDSAVSAIEKLAADHNGIITAMQVATDNDTPVYRYDETTYSDGAALRGYVTVRVPAESYSAFLKGVTGIGTVLYQAEDAQDVTQQHVDMAARLDNLIAEETRLREFFDSATNVEEMLSIERELYRVRGEIESLDAQVKYLERQAAMATVTIDLTEPKPLVRPSGDDWGFGEAITDGFRGAAGVVRVAIMLAIATAPLWLLALLVFFVVRTLLRKRALKRSQEVSPAEQMHEG